MPPSNLQRRLTVVQKAVQALPGVAAATCEDLLAQDQAAQVGPDGKRWAPTKQGRDKAAAAGAKFDEKAQRYRIRGKFATGKQLAGLGQFDPQNHITYQVAVRAGQVVLESNHRAAAFTRWGTRRMPARPKVPGTGGAGGWIPRILKALRGWHG